MKYLFTVVIAVTLLILVGGTLLVSKSQNSEPAAPPTTYEYFWGDGCPHCAKVNEFLSTWDKKDKIQLDKKEVWHNSSNASLMAQRAKTCGISPSDLGVPLLVAPDGKCVNGDDPIIEFFKNLSV